MSDEETSGADVSGADALARARTAVADAVAALDAAHARTEVLAEYEPARRVFGVKRSARLRPMGRVWRLGVLALDEEGGLWAHGNVVRAEKPAIRSITANSVAVHRAYRAAAVKGGIAEGETVVFDAVPVALDGRLLEPAEPGEPVDPAGPAAPTAGAQPAASADSPVVVQDGEVFVRWRAGDPSALAPFEPYLRERVDLLAHPTASDD
ncbi:hypothetical protein ET445_05300 [Agromyces protaetiae]|uniref:Uncharacterized protein n=1 Tax=Agromyces protaetiae TaxID=2509455 RepID=A0A4P6FQP3_9MICO|nr:hypothetical protein [Agromyces protaetiae]QAY72848.1 hypothetical protein ET445_05300 [Agromyces protaetiae]